MHDGPGIPDEMLMAFADGELEGDERNRVADYLSRNPEARERVAMFAQTRDGLARLLNEPLVEPVPERLLATIMGNGLAPAAGSSSHPKPPSGRSKVWETLAGSFGGLFSRSILGWAGAALVAAAFGFVVLATHATVPATPGDDSGRGLVVIPSGTMSASGPLASALETAPGDKAQWLALAQGPAAWSPVITFEAQDGRFCRQYIVTSAERDQTAALACRDPSGRWDIEATQSLGRAASPVVRPVAAGQMQERVEAMIGGGPIVGEAEDALIARHWVK